MAMCLTVTGKVIASNNFCFETSVIQPQTVVHLGAAVTEPQTAVI
jgi:hypothetical protein